MLIFQYKEKKMFSEQLRKLRRLNNLTQTELSKLLNVSNGTIAMWETDKRQPDIDTLKKLANFFNVTTDYLLGKDIKDNNKGVKIPVLGVVPAGVPIEAIEEILEYEEITPEMAKSGEYFGLKVKGDSMSPNILEGDILIVRKQEDANSGDICVVMVNGDDATVKKIKKDPKGLTLIPNNPAYDVTYFTNEEIVSIPVRIIGKVVESRRSY